MWESWVQSLGREDPLEKEMAIHSSILAWRIPCTEKPSRLQSTGSQRVGHDWATSHHLTTAMPTAIVWTYKNFLVVNYCNQFSSVTPLCLILQPMDCTRQASLSITSSQSLLKLCPLSQWCHATISSFVVPFTSCPQPFPASGSFSVSQFFTSGGQNIGVSASASVLPMNI